MSQIIACKSALSSEVRHDIFLKQLFNPYKISYDSNCFFISKKDGSGKGPYTNSAAFSWFDQ
jgi:hypothetical protein